MGVVAAELNGEVTLAQHFAVTREAGTVNLQIGIGNDGAASIGDG